MSHTSNNPHTPTSRELKILIEGNEYSVFKQFLTGKQLKELAKLPLESELYLTISHPYKDELITNDEEVDLARPGIESFYIKKALKLIIDEANFEWPKQYILGSEIRKLGNIRADYEIFLCIKGPWEDEKISDTDKVDLARPGIEHFYSCKPNTNNGYKILPIKDRKFLETKEFSFIEVNEVGKNGLIIKNFPILPEGKFSQKESDLLIILPSGYSDIPPDMFYFASELTLAGNGTYPAQADYFETHFGIRWQRWSRHADASSWTPGKDGIHSYIQRVFQALNLA